MRTPSTRQWLSPVLFVLVLGAMIALVEADRRRAMRVPSPAPTATIMPPLPPARLRIARLGIDAPVAPVGRTKAGAMDVPASPWEVGWFAEGIAPGLPGNAVLAGHVDAPGGGRGVFAQLRRLRAGDRVSVTLADGTRIAFRVHRRAVYPAAASPMEEIFGPAGEPHLHLITCSGPWQGTTYGDRLVVYAEAAAEQENGFVP